MSTANLDSLVWIKTELERTLETARRCLDAYAEEPDNHALFDEFAAELHQAAGTFSMIEVRGGYLLASHMESLAQAIRDGRLKGDNESLELLMRGCIELSDYLERMVSGMRDTPDVLLAVTNEIRVRLGREPLTPERPARAGPVPSRASPNGEDLVSLSAELRPDFQAALLAFYRGPDVNGAIARMREVVGRLEAAATSPPVFEWLWIAGGLLEALGDGGLSPTLGVRKTLGQFERELKRHAAGSEGALAEAPPEVLIAGMLAEIEQAQSSGKRVAAIRTTYRLGSERTEEEVGTTRRPGAALLESAGGAILEDLGRVRDRVDIFVRTGSKSPADLAPLDGMLKKVGDALAMLGLETAQTHIEHERESIRALASGAETNDAALLGLATGLIGVESDVEAFLAGSGEGPASVAERGARLVGIREALADISRIKEGFSEYLRQREPDYLAELPRTADVLARTLDFLAFDEAAALIGRIGRYVEGVAAGATMPERIELDRLADAVVSVEYYLETLQRGREPPASILENADRAMQVLEATPARVPEAASEPEPSAFSESQSETETETEQIPEAPGLPSEPLVAEVEELPPVREPGADPEIVAVFLDEADEVCETLAETWPQWQADPGDRDALATIRRSFHTLKGSGRMVGARRLGEFAWSYENLLNRVIDYTLPPAEAIATAVGEAVGAVKELLAEFDGGAEPSADVQGLHERAWRLARGAGLDERAEAVETETEIEAAAETEAEAPEIPAPEPEPVPRIDSVLYGIYRRETEEHLASIQAWLDTAARDDAVVSFDLYRAVHTLSGSAQMAGVDEMEALFSPLDAVLAHIGEGNAGKAYRLVPGVGAAQVMGRELLAAYGDSTQPLPAWEPVAESIEELDREITTAVAESVSEEQAPEEAEAQAAVPEEVPSEGAVLKDAAIEETEPEEAAPEEVAGEEAEVGEAVVGRVAAEVVDLHADANYDAEVAELFHAEAAELLDGADAAVHVWSGDHDLVEPLSELLRRLHTLKGGARMAGVTPLGDLTHELETLLTHVADGRIAVSGDLLHLVERTLDRLHQMLTHVAGDGRIPLDPTIVAELHEYARFGTETLREEEAEVAREVEAIEEAEEAEEDRGSDALEVPDGDELVAEAAVLAEAEEREAPQLRHEMARVRADLLESSINSAGEASIYRSRIEQQLVNMGVHLAELDRTVERLRNQLRELEIETEAQILSSYEQPESAERDFDPLELDRYTRINELSRALTEAVSDLTSLRSLFATELRQSNVLLERQGRVTADLQDALMRTRMVPFSLSAPRLRRMVRQVSAESGKRVDFELRGVGGEMDRQLMGHILPALEHLLRNAVVHGVEEPAVRAERGKPEAGKISLTLRRDGGDMLIDVEDDGGGLDLDAIREKAEQEGIIRRDARLTEAEITELVFRSGFSTAASVTQTAGRGVGMDVVAAEARQVGGSSEIYSTPGKGTRCRMRLPATLAITQVLLVRIGQTRYPVALASIGAVSRLPRIELERLLAQDEAGYEYGGEEYELASLARILGEEPPPPEEQAARQPLLLVNAGGRRVALIAEDMEGSREIVVKPVGPQIARVPGFAGATIFGDGSIGLLLDLSALVRALPQFKPEETPEVLAPVQAAPEAEAEPLIMIVDDSITVRRVTQRLLERHDARVLTARDGVEALEMLQDQIPDTMLLDIEMPRMDGYELAGHMKNDERLCNIPIIVITSRTGEKHRARAKQVGIEHYLGKPYQDAALIEAVQAVVPRFAPLASRKAQGE
ncbi:MAG: Hpt domain-containing protein [Gammaproteobacteria bacterium]